MGRAVPVRGEKKRSDIGAFGALHGSPSLSPVRRAIRPPLPGAKRLPSLPLNESPGATPKASISLPPQTGEPEEQSAAAARIQSRQRGRVARRAARKRKEAHMAATRIQTRERSRAARARMESRRKQATASREDAPEPEWMEGASPSINAHGHVGGPKVHSHKLATGRHASGDATARTLDLHHENRMAARIQARQRGRKARVDAAEQRAAVRQIQAAQRGRVTRRQLNDRQVAATKLQSVQRGRAARRQAATRPRVTRGGKKPVRTPSEDQLANHPPAPVRGKKRRSDTGAWGVVQGSPAPSAIKSHSKLAARASTGLPPLPGTAASRPTPAKKKIASALLSNTSANSNKKGVPALRGKTGKGGPPPLPNDWLYEEERAVKKALRRARKKFDQLDADGNGKLDGDELSELATWVFSSFNPGGKPMNPAEKRQGGRELPKLLDADGDGELDFEEFAEWFTQTVSGADLQSFFCLFSGLVHFPLPIIDVAESFSQCEFINQRPSFCCVRVASKRAPRPRPSLLPNLVCATRCRSTTAGCCGCCGCSWALLNLLSTSTS